jgi:hypothetical protein
MEKYFDGLIGCGNRKRENDVKTVPYHFLLTNEKIFWKN